MVLRLQSDFLPRAVSRLNWIETQIGWTGSGPVGALLVHKTWASKMGLGCCCLIRNIHEHGKLTTFRPLIDWLVYIYQCGRLVKYKIPNISRLQNPPFNNILYINTNHLVCISIKDLMQKNKKIRRFNRSFSFYYFFSLNI